MESTEITKRTSVVVKFLKGIKWMWDDFRIPSLIWVKIIFFLQSASLVTLYPYLTLHMRSLGFNMEDAAIVNSVIPVADIFGPPLAGILADTLGNFRLFMAIVTLLNGASSLLLLTIPKNDFTTNTINMKCCFNSTMDFGHPGSFLCASENPKKRDNVSIWYKAFYSPGPNPKVTNNSINLIINDIDMNRETGRLVESNRITCYTKTNSFTRNTSMVDFNVVKGRNTSIPELKYCDEVSCEVDNQHWRHSVFWQYLSIRVVLDILRASSLMLFEGALIVTIKEQGGDYGLQKLFGTFGGILFGPLAGLLIDVAETHDTEINAMEDDNNAISEGHSNGYNPIIYLYFALRLLASLCLLKLNLDFKPPAKKIFKNIRNVICRINVLSYLIVFLFAGIMWGFLETFLFWYLEDLGATKFLLGISLGIGTLLGIPLTIFSHLLLKNIDHQVVALLAIAVYVIRLFGYSMIGKSVLLCILFEGLKPFCTTLLLISAMTFVKDVSPLTTTATLQGIFGTAYFGIGRGLGGFIGGVTTETFGFIETFQIFGIIGLGTGVIYAFTIVCYLKNLK